MRYLFGILLLLSSLAMGSSEAFTPRVVGLQDDCTGACTSFPTNLSIVCNGQAGNTNCPQYFSPDWTDTANKRLYGITNSLNPAKCVKSTDGGPTWTTCTTDPFGATIGPVAFGLATDGSLLAAVSVNNTTQSCVINKSIDGGVSWQTKFTSNNIVLCGAWAATAMSSPLKCAKSSTHCVIIGVDVTTLSKVVAVFSSDNGENWTVGSIFTTTTSTPPFVAAAVSDDGVQGVTGGTSVQSISSLVRTTTGSGGWSLTLAFGTAPAVSSRCTAPLTFQNKPMLVCNPASSINTVFHLVDVSGITPVIAQSFTPVDAGVTANSPDIMAIGWDTNTAYFMGRSMLSSSYNIWITRDGFASIITLGQLTPVNPFTACCRGDVYKWNGAIYWSSGGLGGSAQLMKIS